jgi:hypothetical protein
MRLLRAGRGSAPPLNCSGRRHGSGRHERKEPGSSRGGQQEQTEAVVEIKRRLKRLENDSNRLIRLNNELLDKEMAQVQFDEASDTLTFSFKGSAHSIKINRADPDTPVRLVGSTSMGAYVAGKPTPDGEATDELKSVMEQLLEGFYDNAFRITKLAGTRTGRPKFECRGITMVRNKLITHPPEGAIYSFGFSSTGPVVKPIHRGELEWTDAGLVPNVEMLREALLNLFAHDA